VHAAVLFAQIRFNRLVLAVFSGSATTSAGSDFLVEVFVL
jgi:hypothetical protein